MVAQTDRVANPTGAQAGRWGAAGPPPETRLAHRRAEVADLGAFLTDILTRLRQADLVDLLAEQGDGLVPDLLAAQAQLDGVLVLLPESAVWQTATSCFYTMGRNLEQVRILERQESLRDAVCAGLAACYLLERGLNAALV